MKTKLYLVKYIKENILFKELLRKVFFDASEYFNTKVYFFSTVKIKFYTSRSLILLKLYLLVMLETNFFMFLFSSNF